MKQLLTLPYLLCMMSDLTSMSTHVFIPALWSEIAYGDSDCEAEECN